MPISHPANGLQDFIAISRYARYSPELRRRETWAEAVGRVRDMHLAHYADTSLGDAALTALSAGDVAAEDLTRIGRLGRLHEVDSCRLRRGGTTRSAAVDAQFAVRRRGDLQQARPHLQLRLHLY